MKREVQTSRLTHPLEELTFGERLEPQLIGIHEAGEPMLVAYQTAGGSQSGDVPGWRTFITTSIEEVEVTDQRFSGPRGDLDITVHRMIEIFARA